MSHRTKRSPEEKADLIQRYLRGEISAAKGAKVAGLNFESFRAWLRLYKQEGSLRLLSTEKNRTYSPELERIAVEAYLAGEGSHYAI